MRCTVILAAAVQVTPPRLDADADKARRRYPSVPAKFAAQIIDSKTNPIRDIREIEKTCTLG